MTQPTTTPPAWFDVHVPMTHHGHHRLYGIRVPAVDQQAAIGIGGALGLAITEATDGQWTLDGGQHTSAASEPVTIHPEAEDRYRRETGVYGIALCIDRSGTPVLRYPGGSVTISHVGNFDRALADLVTTLAAIRETESTR